jgi:hypothetical protein
MSFTLDVKKFADGFIDGAEVAVRGTTIKLWSAIILMTPVAEGRARSSWFATGQQPSTKVSTTTDKKGDTTVSNAERVVMSLKGYETFTLTSNLPYIERLEMGWSDQSPTGMVRVSVMRFNSLLEAESRKSLPK